jgi:hypothetical protein
VGGEVGDAEFQTPEDRVAIAVHTVEVQTVRHFDRENAAVRAVRPDELARASPSHKIERFNIRLVVRDALLVRGPP